VTHFDVFNGDADGICALHQLRLRHPVDAQLVTGVKRDVRLLRRVKAQSGDSVTVLDASLDANRVRCSGRRTRRRTCCRALPGHVACEASSRTSWQDASLCADMPSSCHGKMASMSSA